MKFSFTGFDVENYDVAANSTVVLAPFAGEVVDVVGDVTLLWPLANYLSMSPDDVIGVPPGVGVVSGVWRCWGCGEGWGCLGGEYWGWLQKV